MTTTVEKCPQCGGPMELVDIDGIPSWSCPADWYAFAVDQEWAEGYDDEEAAR